MSNFQKLSFAFRSELVNYSQDKLNEFISCDSDIEADDLHNELFNTDYYIIGYYDCEEWLKNCGFGVFGSIEIIKEYEEQNFGAVSTDLSSSEHVLNMLVYILGEELLSISKTLSRLYSKKLTPDNMSDIANELNSAL